MRRPLLGLVALIGAIASGVALWPLRDLVPMVRDDLVLDGIVVAVALDWRDFGLPRALQRLQIELDASGVGPWVEASQCGLVTDDLGGREVRCAWDVVVDHAMLGIEIPIAFDSVARIDREGRLHP